MTSQASEAAIEERLRAFLAAELRRAEADFPLMPRRKPHQQRGARLLGLAAATAGVVVAIALLRPFGGLLPATPGGDPLGPDGFPRSIGGEPVLRGDDIEDRSGSASDPTSFLAGGYLILHPVACTSASPVPSEGCGEDWRLEDSLGAQPLHSFPLVTPGGGATFVRTSGAPTVFRVRPAAGNRQRTLLIEAVAWRQATKGRIPIEATPPEGGEINEALVPDFVGAWGGPTGETIVGYVPKELLLHPISEIGGTLENPPQGLPLPVYGENLITLVGHMVPGHGFVPLGASPAPLPVSSPSSAPSSSTLAIQCPETTFDPPATLRCQEAIDAALSALSATHPDVLSASFTYHLPCGADGVGEPRMGCPFAGRGDAGFVIITSAAGGSEVIRVSKANNGTITALPPEPYTRGS